MIRKLLIISGLAVAAVSCTKNFAKENVDPTKPAAVPLNYLLASAETEMGGSQNDPGYTQWRTNLFYCAPMTQQMASTTTTQYAGDKYFYADEPSGAWFGFSSSGEGHYLNALKTMVQLITSARADSIHNVNTLAIARILKVYLFQQMTDIYGDVPYFDAGLGAISQNVTPAFDKQSAIYADMLNELAIGEASLDTLQANPGSADMAYSGNLKSWKHFANSLMLRLALRIVNVDPTDAQAWAVKAISSPNGLIASNAENFQFNWIGGPSQSINPNSYDLGASNNEHRNEVYGVGDIQWGKTLIDMMKARQDPRLGMISDIPNQTSQVIFGAGTSTPSYLGDTVAAHQNGLPNGLTEGAALMTATGFSSSKGCCFSVPTPFIFQDNTPQILLSYAESELMLTEAIARTWVPGNVTTTFQAAQQASLGQVTWYNPSFTFNAGQISAYQAANPINTASLATEMTAIHTEMYSLTAVTLNFIEEWADWRRTGIPALTPVNYPGNASGGTIPRRLQYPHEQTTLDPTGYNAAVTDQGADVFTTHIWWDK